MSYKEEKKRWQDIRYWLAIKLGVRGIRLTSIYDKLPKHIKDILHKCICVPVQTTTHRQREDLLKALQNSAGRDTLDPLYHMPDEECDRLLSPPTEKEKEDYLSEFKSDV